MVGRGLDLWEFQPKSESGEAHFVWQKVWRGDTSYPELKITYRKSSTTMSQWHIATQRHHFNAISCLQDNIPSEFCSKNWHRELGD